MAIKNLKVVKVSTLPTKGRFYPKDINIWLTPLGPADYEKWQSVDYTNLASVNEGLYNIIKPHVLVSSLSSEEDMSYDDLLEGDRFAIILMIREFSGLKPVTIIDENGTPFILTTDILETFKWEDDIMNMYDEETLSFIVPLSNNYAMTFNLPTIGVMRNLYNFLQEFCEGNDDENAVEEMTGIVQLLCYMTKDSSSIAINSFEDNIDMIQGFINTLHSFSPYDFNTICTTKNTLFSLTYTLRIKTPSGKITDNVRFVKGCHILLSND